MAEYVPRLTNDGIYLNKYWYVDNPLYTAGFGLPNCTCYAWGRWYELMGEKPNNLSLGDAGKWYDYNAAGGYYGYGSEPALGAIACWQEPGEAGHVAVVEQINDDGSFVISQSGYYRPIAEYPPDTKNYFWTSVVDGTTKMASWMTTYVFQGFIYCPGFVTPDTQREWISKNAYLTQSEMENNAIMVWNYFGSRGWTLNAVCAMLGNMQTESTINPGIWESLVVQGGGYGLVQWTPYTKYSEWAGTDWQDNGDKQCERIVYERDNGLQWFRNPSVDIPDPPITFSEFSDSTLPVDTLANYFLWYYEHPADPDQPNRAAQAQAWYEFLYGIDPSQPDAPNKTAKKRRTSSKTKWMFYFTRMNRRM